MELPKQFLNLNVWTDIDLVYIISVKSYMGSDCLKEIAHSNKSIIHSLSLLWGVLEMFIVALNPLQVYTIQSNRKEFELPSIDTNIKIINRLFCKRAKFLSFSYKTFKEKQEAMVISWENRNCVRKSLHPTFRVLLSTSVILIQGCIWMLKDEAII